MIAAIDIIKSRLTLFARAAFIIFFLAPLSETKAQPENNGRDSVFGFDPWLYNGKYYTFFSPMNARGNQYLNDRLFESGTITLRGTIYTGLLLNYDIYNQQLLLKYAVDTGNTKVIIISDAWLENFSILDKNFIVFRAPDNEKHICQKIGTGQTFIHYFWKKSMQMVNIADGMIMTFSKPSREMYLLTGEEMVRYWNNRSFINLFDPEDQEDLREYFRDKHINVKKASDPIMEGLIDHCNTFNKK